MNWFVNLKVGTKLIGGFLFVAAIAAIIGGLGIQSTSRMNDMTSMMYDRETVGLRHAADAQLNLLGAGRAIRSAMLAPDEKDRADSLALMERRFEAVKASLNAAEALFFTEGGKARVAETRQSALAYQAMLEKTVEQLRTEPLRQARGSVDILLGQARPLATKAEELMSGLLAEKQSNAEAFNQETEVIYSDVRALLIGFTLAGALLGILIGMLLTRSLTHQLGGEPGDVARVANAIARGDLTSFIGTSKARNGSVLQAMDLMQASLRRVVGTVRLSSDNVATGSNQIAAGNIDLSQRTEEQAANITQTASAMDELASTVKNNAEVAEQAAQLARTASSSADKGGEIVGNVVATMGEINAASKKIVDIIGVIDTIAFQTNILALNAAVEAARAGEQGRGFAVVAAEVRSLAQKSAAAAKDIKTLIGDSVEKVNVGSKMADAAGDAMQDIVAQVQRVTDLINEISAATAEQTSGLNQINEAVTQLSEVTQQNAALVEESAAAAGSLSEQAHNLVSAVGAFKLDDENAQAGPIVIGTQPAARLAAPGRAAANPKSLGSTTPPLSLQRPGQATANAEWQSF